MRRRREVEEMYDDARGDCHRSDDEALIDRLARALATVDPPPRGLEMLAAELFTWRTVDAELDVLSRTGAAIAPTGTD
jgi:hypothetical protein